MKTQENQGPKQGKIPEFWRVPLQLGFPFAAPKRVITLAVLQNMLTRLRR
jgi:hypothetical protein